ncbi:hypothetical protein I3256_04500 [Photobacterium damselae]|uniref:hypothetical protein n=1 Tax=Photobacterium damselae TaxID=38293 RepID=UPI001EDF49F2|nr:hypothetical protein [Photobacterium damselae]MCG3815189.1 hypothetical protein [Photobacterium damselae]
MSSLYLTNDTKVIVYQIVKDISRDYFPDCDSMTIYSLYKAFPDASKLSQILTGHEKELGTHFIIRVHVELNVRRLIRAGINEFKWVHNKSCICDHEQYDGIIFNINTPPIIKNDLEKRGLPSSMLGCTCDVRMVSKYTKK